MFIWSFYAACFDFIGFGLLHDEGEKSNNNNNDNDEDTKETTART